jgi:hypothetical protein
MTCQMTPVRALRATVSVLSGLVLGSASMWGIQVAGADPLLPMVPITYEITGPGTAAYITYQTTRQLQHKWDVELPFSDEFSDWTDTISARHFVRAEGAAPGSITCAIKVDGRVVTQNTATGNPPKVACETDEPFPPRLRKSG